MLNGIVEGIVVQLKAVFEDRCEIYQNNDGQELKKPCFLLPLCSRSCPLCLDYGR